MNFDTSKYKVWTWKHPLVLHWIINPGLAVNELVLGQRIPKVSLLEKDRSKSLAERSFVPCPHCNTIHSGLKWSPQNKTAFGNWFGLYCDHCEGIIPCVRNLTSAVILAATFPVWIWFVKSWKKKWLQVQKQKFSKPLTLTPPEIKHAGIKRGLVFGLFMFVFNDLILPLFEGESYKPLKLLGGFIIWMLGGLLFGYVMKKWMFNSTKKNSQDKAQEIT
jgi:hypothetical protein